MTLYLRRATIEDAEDILRWRNDPKTRENSFTSDVIDLETHMAWFERKLGQSNCLMYILMADECKAGNIRVDITDGVGEISYMIAPEHRGKGYGKEILALIEKELPPDARILVGEVLENNIASARCFEANGYSRSEGDGKLVFTKKIQGRSSHQ